MQFSSAPLTATAVHLCVDMQRLFAPGAIWSTPWSAAALPQVLELARRFPERTIFTRFLPPRRPSDMPGTWQGFYRHWHSVTRQEIEPGLLRLHPELEALSPRRRSSTSRPTRPSSRGGWWPACGTAPPTR